MILSYRYVATIQTLALKIKDITERERIADTIILHQKVKQNGQVRTLR